MQKTKIRDLKSNFDEFLVKNFKKKLLNTNPVFFMKYNS